MSKSSEIGIVIPTLGQRQEYLIETIKSARIFGDVFLVVVVPGKFREKIENLSGIDKIVIEAEPGLSAAINLGINMMPEEINFVGWIGDDDLLAAGAGKVSARFLSSNPDVVMTFGICNYINQNGEIIGVNKSGQWAVPLLRYGPDLIPQPGSIYRRSTFDKIGQIDTKYSFAFDFDLFSRLSKAGRIKYLALEVGSFRWHGDSKTVNTRKSSVLEASRVRRNQLPIFLKVISVVWELPVVLATYYAGLVVSRKVNRSLKSRDKT